MRQKTRVYADDLPTLDGEDIKIMLTCTWWFLGRVEFLRTGDNPPRVLATIPPGLKLEISLQSTAAAFGGHTSPYCSRLCGRLYHREYDIGCPSTSTSATKTRAWNA